MTEHPNVKRAREAEREVDRVRAEGKPLARDVLEKFMLLFASLASRYQPGTTAAPNKFADNAQFRFWSERAVDAAKALAIYQSPRLQALAVAAPAPTDQKTIRFKLNVFENGRQVGVDLQSMSDDELIRHYRSRIAAGPIDGGGEPAAALPAPEAAVPVTSEPMSEPDTVPAEPVVVEPVPAEHSVEAPDPAENVVEFPSDAVKQYAASIASSEVNGRPVAPRISEQALQRAGTAMSHAEMPRTSGVFDRWK